ncbi:MAG: glycogen-debranching protein, partial [Candidatus Hydrogenedentes bacterium]|nr:glycogen-debranching protein [Candidatus Hydrogenedentota bacterium]
MPSIDVDKLTVTPGRPYPMGPFVANSSVRFSIFSRHATRVWLDLFEHVEDKLPVWEYELDAMHHRTGDVWSIVVHHLREGAYFMYRMDGPFDPKAGHRYNPNVYLLDPYAKAFAGDIHAGTMKCIAVRDEVDWANDVRPHRPMQETVIYETHVRGLTIHPSSAVAAPGTYEGLIEKIPYLKELGVTAVELLPIQEFGESLLGRCSLTTEAELRNYWGYSNVGFFAPTWTYAAHPADFQHLTEFRRMVHALHAAGIEVILDVVFNHTSEGNELGPTLSFRGIDNKIYYHLDEDGEYLNYSGCGNTLNCNHPLMRDLILDCLRYWVAVMHIDGFRFDLAAILGRNVRGEIEEDAPLIERIAEDAVLRDTKLIAEAWDAGGAYLVGSFGDNRWAEWNGRYRDDVRRYWRGDPGLRGQFASRLTGSADLYQNDGRSTEHTINFITCHDGFTLRDLVSFKRKHNEANGEGNRDGA